MSAVVTLAAGVAPVAAAWSSHAWWLRRRLHRARRDPLTGLPTRAEFEKRTTRMLRSRPCAVVVADLDGFKQLNDSCGHAAGDAALSQAATCLTTWLHAYEDRGFAARLGGDEFALVLPHGPHSDQLAGGLSLLREWVSQPFLFEGRHVQVGASIGAYLASAGTFPAHALRRADEAMYAAKENRSQGGGGVFVTDLHTVVRATRNGRRAGRAGTHHTSA
ncbi:GGDEF domain-containing protein [Streptomyces sp. enrichment culture]|uniref:GGDEF domain-containing protein n=1 Tax=Streptomyces sp. enrichment culture TaxID=1795815 RepID=UPI003F5431FD